MGDHMTDDGLDTTALWAMAWALGVVAFASLIRLIIYADNDTAVQAEMFVWVLIGALAGAFSACCAVLVGVKSAEQRLSQRSDSFNV